VVQNYANSVESFISFMMLKHSSFKMQKFVTNLYKTGELKKKNLSNHLHFVCVLIRALQFLQHFCIIFSSALWWCPD